MTHLPFVYKVTNKTTGFFYYGSRYAKRCSPSDLWVTYFTSSKRIHALIEQYGKEDWILEIIEVFHSGEDAAKREVELLTESKDDPLNINICRSIARHDLERNSKMGKVKGLIMYQNKKGFFDTTHPDYKKWKSDAGRISGNKQKELGIGIHAQTPEERLELVARAREIQMEQGKNAFTTATSEKQAERGRKGGVKNAGFKWYTDGYTDYKYTASMSIHKSLEQYLSENPGFKRGRSNAHHKN